MSERTSPPPRPASGSAPASSTIPRPGGPGGPPAGGPMAALAPLVGTEFIPEADNSYTQIGVTLPVGTSLARGSEKMAQVEAVVLGGGVPGRALVMVDSGACFTMVTEQVVERHAIKMQPYRNTFSQAAPGGPAGELVG